MDILNFTLHLTKLCFQYHLLFVEVKPIFKTQFHYDSGEQGRPRKGVGFYFAGGHSEKSRYLLLKSLSGEMANVNVPLVLILKTLGGQDLSGPETIINYIVLSTFKIYITLSFLFPEFGFTVW